MRKNYSLIKNYEAMSAGASKLKVVDIVKAQHEDATIARVLQLLKTSHKPSVTEIRRETPQVRKYTSVNGISYLFNNFIGNTNNNDK
jgi:hypothetical protein